jgi:enoyl-CoA hydratase/carnithine racemase
MLSIDRRGDVTVVRLQHGPVNALYVDLLRALPDAVTHAPGPLVITGAGRSFSAGLDLRRILQDEDSYTAALLAALCDALLAAFDHPAPTVAAVNGHAIAAGCLLALRKGGDRWPAHSPQSLPVISLLVDPPIHRHPSPAG